MHLIPSTMNNLTLPAELISVIGSDKIDFSILAKRNHPGRHAVSFIVFGTIWLVFLSRFVVAFFGPLFAGKKAHFTKAGVPTTVGWDNLSPMIVPALVVGLFLLVGIALIGGGLYAILQKGGYFVATNSRLIKFRKGKINIYSWDQFSGNIEMNSYKGALTLQLNTGRMASHDDGPNKYIPDVVYISGIPNVLEVEKICRKLIEESDPARVKIA